MRQTKTRASIAQRGSIEAGAAWVAITGGALAWYLYISGSGTLRRWSAPGSAGGRLRTWAAAGFGLDALAERGVARGVRTGAFLLWLAVDVVLIDLLKEHLRELTVFAIDRTTK